MRQLPPAARITLCNVLQVPTQPVSIRIQSDYTSGFCGPLRRGSHSSRGWARRGRSTGSSGSTRTGPPAGGVGRIRSSGSGSGGSGTREVRRSHQRRGAQDWQSVGELLSAEQSRRGAGATACRCRGSGGGRSDGAVAAACGGSGDISPGFRRGSGGGGSRGWTRRHAGRRARNGRLWEVEAPPPAGAATNSRRRRACLGASSSTDIYCDGVGTPAGAMPALHNLLRSRGVWGLRDRSARRQP